MNEAWLNLGLCLVALAGIFVVASVFVVRRRRASSANNPIKACRELPVFSANQQDEDITRVAAFTVTAQPIPSLVEDEREEDAAGNESKAILHFEDESWAGINEPTGPVDLILTSSAAETDRGIARRRNEDAFLVDTQLELYVVADGMGGYAGGDVASRMAVEEVRASIRSGAGANASGDRPRRAAELVSAIERANDVIYKAAKQSKQFEGMGTTIVAARFSRRKQRVYLAHVGDSRIYRFRAGKLQLLTKDHTLAGRGVSGPLASNLRRAVGIGPSVKVDLVVDKPVPEDVFLLCSDGLTKMVDENHIGALLAEHEARDLSRTVSALVTAANARGGRDNVTVLLVRVREITMNVWRKPRDVVHA